MAEIDYKEIGEVGGKRPVVSLVVTNPDARAGGSVEIEAVLDTAADQTCLLESDVRRLGLGSTAFKKMRTPTGVVDVVQYVAEVAFPPDKSRTIRVLGIPGPFSVVGRDLLDDRAICFNGPGERWRIPCGDDND